MRRIGRFFLWVFTIIGILTAATFVSAGIWFALVDDDAPELPERMVLSLDLNKGVTETKSGSPFGFLSRGPGPVSIREFLSALEKAETDERVVGLAVRLGATGVSLAQAQELRDAVAKFRKSGKSAVAFATNFSSARGRRSNTISRPPSTRSGCSRRVNWQSPGFRSNYRLPPRRLRKSASKRKSGSVRNSSRRRRHSCGAASANLHGKICKPSWIHGWRRSSTVSPKDAIYRRRRRGRRSIPVPCWRRKPAPAA